MVSAPKLIATFIICIALTAIAASAVAQDTGNLGDKREKLQILKKLRERQAQKSGNDDGGILESMGEMGGSGPAGGNGKNNVEIFEVNGREVQVYVPDSLKPQETRSLLVILHGGMGSAKHVRHSLQMDGMADKYGFINLYLNGNSSRLNANMRTWNAGECCGSSAREKIDDVGYIVSAARAVAKKYGISPARIYGMGHSNGAMMTQRVMCETGLYQAAVPVSGPLEIETQSCPAAKGRRLLAIHGTDDVNVSINGGRGEGIAGVDFKSQTYTKAVFERSGATYDLWQVAGAAHKPKTIRSAITAQGGDMQEDVVKFLGLN